MQVVWILWWNYQSYNPDLVLALKFRLREITMVPPMQTANLPSPQFPPRLEAYFWA